MKILRLPVLALLVAFAAAWPRLQPPPDPAVRPDAPVLGPVSLLQAPPGLGLMVGGPHRTVQWSPTPGGRDVLTVAWEGDRVALVELVRQVGTRVRPLGVEAAPAEDPLGEAEAFGGLRLGLSLDRFRRLSMPEPWIGVEGDELVYSWLVDLRQDGGPAYSAQAAFREDRLVRLTLVALAQPDLLAHP